MKKTTFINKTTNNNDNINFPIGNSTNYSKMLDDLILADIIDKNPYLYTTKSNSDSILSDTTSYSTWTNSLNTKKTKKIYIDDAIEYLFTDNNPYKLDTTYYLDDGTPIIFFEDSIQIGFDLYYFKDLKKPKFISSINSNIKKKIIELYIDGLKISIYK